MKNANVIFRLNVDDLEKLETDAKKLNITKSQLLRLYIKDKKLNRTLANIARSMEFNIAMLHELSRIAGNINQIAYKLNTNQATSEDSINEFRKEANATKKIFGVLAGQFKQSNKSLYELYK